MSRKNRDLENFQLFFNLTSDFILVKEHGCMDGWMNGANSDNAISIQKMVTLNMQHCSETSIQLGPGHYRVHIMVTKHCFVCVWGSL